MPSCSKMPRVLCLWGMLLALAACVLTAQPALAADERPYSPDAQEHTKMSVFLSNFTELGFMNFDVRQGGGDGLHLGSADAVAQLIHFGIWHNFRNNFTSHITHCTVQDCRHGSLTITGTQVAESVKKYFDLPLKNQSVRSGGMSYFFDGTKYHFEGADGETAYFAQVEQVFQKADGTFRMTGYLYNADEKSERPATFEALAKPHTYKGKKTWAILALTSQWQ